jgi:SH3 domain protein
MTRIANFVVLMAFVGVAQAEQLFVSDKLVVSVYQEANQDSEKLATLETGDAVESIEKVEGFTHVKLIDGRDGWVRSSYLSAQTPAIVRLKELESERGAGPAAPPASTLEEIKRLKEQNATLRSEVEALKVAATQKSAAMQNPAPTSNTVPPVRNEARAPKPDDDGMARQSLIWGTALAIAAGIIGFGIGYRTLAKRIARKYGNLKIY